MTTQPLPPADEALIAEFESRLRDIQCDNYGECYIATDDISEQAQWLRTLLRSKNAQIEAAREEVAKDFGKVFADTVNWWRDQIVDMMGFAGKGDFKGVIAVGERCVKHLEKLNNYKSKLPEATTTK